MNTINPDKYIRKGLITSLSNEGYSNVFDKRVPTINNPQNYIIISTQTKVENVDTKCGSKWDCSVLFDIVTRFDATGNLADRVQVNDLEEKVIVAMNNFEIDNFQILDKFLESSNDLDNLNDTENVFRQLVRYRFIINQIV